MPDDPLPSDLGEVSVGPLKLKGVPSWAIVVALVAITLGSLFTLYQKLRAPEYELVSYKAANAAQQALVTEYNKHFGEAPEAEVVVQDDARGKIWVRKFSDPCFTVLRQDRPGGPVTARLIMDQDERGPHAQREAISDQLSWVLSEVLLATGVCVTHTDRPVRTWYGRERRGEWVQVYRLFGDGCQHWQWFDAVHGLWDVDAQGANRVTWVACVH